ncbi:MAG: hypothetical protein C3F13_10410 [Anaerolineales bacterium]|nr:hypothetical protein [Anaerolineae bacterium]PWB53023.1 MAG: hypothetical protein C3F13_10410 [Anaerolineales bacterium]
MQNSEVDLLFPSRAIEPLRKLRGEQWERLISHLVELEPTDPEQAAFVLFMVRIGGCTTCQSDSFRAMRGCVVCASNTVRRYKGSDQALIDLYDEAKRDIISYMKEV